MFSLLTWVICRGSEPHFVGFTTHIQLWLLVRVLLLFQLNSYNELCFRSWVQCREKRSNRLSFSLLFPNGCHLCPGCFGNRLLFWHPQTWLNNTDLSSATLMLTRFFQIYRQSICAVHWRMLLLLLDHGIVATWTYQIDQDCRIISWEMFVSTS